MQVEHTGRGFEIINFVDRNGADCSLQQSSAAEYTEPGVSAIWLGASDRRMHLSLNQVKELLPHLKSWVKNGSFKVKVKTANPDVQQPQTEINTSVVR